MTDNPIFPIKVQRRRIDNLKLKIFKGFFSAQFIPRAAKNEPRHLEPSIFKKNDCYGHTLKVKQSQDALIKQN